MNISSPASIEVAVFNSLFAQAANLGNFLKSSGPYYSSPKNGAFVAVNRFVSARGTTVTAT